MASRSAHVYMPSMLCLVDNLWRVGSGSGSMELGAHASAHAVVPKHFEQNQVRPLLTSAQPGVHLHTHSTLLRLMIGCKRPISGSVELGVHAVVPNYFEQN